MIVKRVPTSYPSATARKKWSPVMANCSPRANAAGITAQPGCDCDPGWESSVSSACASIPFVSAASIGPHTNFDDTTVATAFPPNSSANANAKRPGGSADPEIIAARVSRTWRFVFSATSSGKAFELASLMYALRVFMTGPTVSGLPSAGAVATGASMAATLRGNAEPAAAKPASSNKPRRVSPARSVGINISLFSLRAVSVLPLTQEPRMRFF